MSKQSGLGDNFYVAGYDLSGDINSLNQISGGPALLDYTTINQSAVSRLGGQRTGAIDFVTFFDPSGAGPFVAGPAPLQTLPTTDQIVTYCRGTGLGLPAACLNGKQVNFDPTRAKDGLLTCAANNQSNGFGLEWGEQLTIGLRTDATATTGTTVDDGAGTSLGAQAYLQVTGFSGTSVHVLVEHSTDNSSWSTLIDFGAQSAIGALRSTAAGTVNRYVRATTATGTFSSITFNVVLVRNQVAVAF